MGHQGTTDGSAPSDPPGQQQPGENTHRLAPSQSAQSVRSELEDGNSTGYITASSSRISQLTASSSQVSQLDNDPLTALPRVHLESMRSSTPVQQSSPRSRRRSTDSVATASGASGGNNSDAPLASLSSVTTFVPNTLADLDAPEQEESELSDDAADNENGDADGEFVPNYEFDLRDPHERTINWHGDGDEEEEDEDEDDQTNERTLTAAEGDVITVSHSHSTSINTFANSRPHSRTASQPDTTSYQHATIPMSLSLSSSWPSLALPPSALKLHRKRRSILLRLLKTWEGREQVLHLTHSLVLLLYSSLHHPVPRTYRSTILRPASAVLAMSIPKPARVAVMQRIYTTAEAIDNFRRVILIARWVTAATEAAMEHWQHRQDHKRQSKAHAEELEMKLTGEEPLDKQADHVDDGFRWLQPPSLAPFDADESASQGGEQSVGQAPAAKIGKATGRGDATGAVGADVAESSSHSVEPDPDSSIRARSGGASALGTLSRVFSRLFRLSYLSAVSEALATVGEACEAAAVLGGGGMFWRAVGIQRLNLPFLSRRRREGIERLGIVLSLCSVLVSLLVLRGERNALRSQLRSAHRRIIRANDKLGWATELAGTTIDRDQALSYRNQEPATVARRRAKARRSEHDSENATATVQMLGPDLEAAARDLDDQPLSSHDTSCPCSSGSESTLSSSDSGLSETWTVVPDQDEALPTLHSHRNRSHSRKHEHKDQSFPDQPKPISVSSLIRSTERSLVRAESDLRNTRRQLQLNFWQKIANWSEASFLAYEAAMPHIDKEGVEAWTGLLASTIRLSSLWKQITWS